MCLGDLFPYSPIIHCVRNPIDTCLSCYFQYFTGQHAYAYDLDHLGHHYNEYKRLMRHYRDVEKIAFLEVKYEELVRNTHAVISEMLEYCGLEWSDDCLHFYNNDRVVRTASYDQVNKPIYTKSINRWKNYEKHINALIDGVSSAAKSTVPTTTPYCNLTSSL